jgi:hypothetical protein
MRRLVYLALAVLLAVVALWLYSRRDALRLQWECYQVTGAASYEQFQQRIAEFERVSSDYNRRRALVNRWHTGNEKFDDFLVKYLFDGQCSEELREVFSRELIWREELLPAWAEHWRRQKPDWEERVGSIRRYLQTLKTAQPPRSITWRDVLDLQAALELRGHGKLARRITPDNWRERFQLWQEADPVW